VAFVYGKKMSSFKPMAIGIALMGFPYFVQNTVVLYSIGAALTISLYVFRD
jgi:hypothetical protein